MVKLLKVASAPLVIVSTSPGDDAVALPANVWVVLDESELIACPPDAIVWVSPDPVVRTLTSEPTAASVFAVDSDTTSVVVFSGRNPLPSYVMKFCGSVEPVLVALLAHGMT